MDEIEDDESHNSFESKEENTSGLFASVIVNNEVKESVDLRKVD